MLFFIYFLKILLDVFSWFGETHVDFMLLFYEWPDVL